MIHVFMRNRVKTRRKAIKIRPAEVRGKGRRRKGAREGEREKEKKEREKERMDTASRQQVCDELSRAESFRANERKDRAGPVAPSPGIKRVLSPGGRWGRRTSKRSRKKRVWVVVTAWVYTLKSSTLGDLSSLFSYAARSSTSRKQPR